MAALKCIFSCFFVYTHCIDRDWVPNAADDMNAEREKLIVVFFAAF